MNIFIDDLRNPKDCLNYIKNDIYNSDDFIIIRTYKDFCDIIDKHINDIKLISFDHDLADFDEEGNEYTGYTCAKYYADSFLINKMNINQLPNILVHSANTIGKENIYSIFNTLYKILK